VAEGIDASMALSVGGNPEPAQAKPGLAPVDGCVVTLHDVHQRRHRIVGAGDAIDGERERDASTRPNERRRTPGMIRRHVVERSELVVCPLRP
jgi:hypothetical protein